MHLTCVGATSAELTALARHLLDVGITDVLALRGDPPDGPGGTWTQAEGGLRYAADLVRLLADIGPFDVGVAAFPESHPESSSRDEDVRRLAEKCDAGASYAITQFFFDVKQYTTLVEDLRAIGCTTPVVPGVLPITNPVQTRRFAAKVGATIPPDLDERFRVVEHDRDATYEVGVRQAIDLTLDLLASGAPGVHFYTMNRVAATREVCAELRLAGAW
jgi:methylenetetrahydrofolate reductase (NADPH)